MGILLFSFNAIAPMLFTVALGWFISRRGHIKEQDITFLNRLTFRYLLAFHIFNSTLSIDYYAEFNPRLILLCSVSIFLTMIVFWLFFAATIKDRARRCIFIVSSFRSNNIIYALPLATNLFGQAGLKAAAMLVPVTIILFNFFTVIVMVYHSQPEKGSGDSGDWGMKTALKRTLIDILKNPLIIGSVLGIICSLLHIKLPAFLRSGINSVASTGTPISLVLLGAQVDFKKLSQDIKSALGACLLRLVIVPGILIPIMVLAGFRGPDLGALMVAFAAPCAVTNLVMARNYNIDPPFAAQTVYLSTVLSMVTMFVAISLLRYLGLF
ncbi:AEC family transporter [Treponema primitia]|uniref:AEC family transporter n=1 Tax=Treponema primitia TaxID=88058 RepID=UPI00398036CB